MKEPCFHLKTNKLDVFFSLSRPASQHLSGPDRFSLDSGPGAHLSLLSAMKTQILSPSDLAMATDALRRGGVVGMPTETVYGLAAMFSNPEACLKVFEVKSRPTFDPLIVHVLMEDRSVPFLNQLSNQGLVRLDQLPAELHSRVELLLRTFWPGPLTIVLPRGSAVPDIVTSGLNTVALRSPKHPVSQALIKDVGSPLVAPSANRFGRISPTTANDVVTELGGFIPYVVDGGRCEIGLESTVVMPLPDGTLRYLRPGAISVQELEMFWRGPVTAFYDPSEAAKDSQGLMAPGRLPFHYAPRTDLHLLPKAISELTEEQWKAIRAKAEGAFVVGVLAFCGDSQALNQVLKERLNKPVVLKVVSPQGNVREAAQLFFGSLRVLDLSPAEILFAEPCPWDSRGLGWALRDRLTKAAWRESNS